MFVCLLAALSVSRRRNSNKEGCSIFEHREIIGRHREGATTLYRIPSLSRSITASFFFLSSSQIRDLSSLLNVSLYIYNTPSVSKHKLPNEARICPNIIGISKHTLSVLLVNNNKKKKNKKEKEAQIRSDYSGQRDNEQPPPWLQTICCMR